MEPQQIFEGLLEPAGIDNPYPLYAALHEHGDIVPASGGFVLVPGYDLANSLLRDSRFRVTDAPEMDVLNPGWRDHPALDASNLLMLNGDDHTRIRSMMAS